MGRPKKQPELAIEPVTESIGKFELSAEIVAGKLTSNAKELKEKIIAELSSYTIDKYIDNPDAAKSDKAFLNKVKDSVADRRKEITAKWNQPLEEFLNEMKSLEKAVQDASNQLKTITDAAVQKEKEIKRKQIEDYWKTLDFTLIPLSKIYNPKWENKTVTLKDVMLEVESVIEKITTELETIRKTADEQDREIAQSFYLDTLDLSSTLLKVNQLKENRAKIKAEEEKKALAEKEKFPEIDVSKFNVTESGNVVKQPITETTVNQTVHVDIGEKSDYSTIQKPLMSFTLKLYGTREELMALRQYIDSHNIKYEKL